MAQKNQTIWFIGEARDHELRFCLRELELIARGWSVELFSSVEETDTTDSPAMVVALQDWSEQYSVASINRLIGNVMPQGRLLCVYGSWCESDGRNGDRWPHAVRVPARLAPERFQRELESISRNESALPLTAGRDERFEHNHSGVTVLRKPVRAEVQIADSRLRDTMVARLAAIGAKFGSGGIVVTDQASVVEQSAKSLLIGTMPHETGQIAPMLSNEKVLARRLRSIS